VRGGRGRGKEKEGIRGRCWHSCFCFEEWEMEEMRKREGE